MTPKKSIKGGISSRCTSCGKAIPVDEQSTEHTLCGYCADAAQEGEEMAAAYREERKAAYAHPVLRQWLELPELSDESKDNFIRQFNGEMEPNVPAGHVLCDTAYLPDRIYQRVGNYVLDLTETIPDLEGWGEEEKQKTSP